MSNVRLDVLVEEGGRWYVYSEDRSKRLGGPYDSKEEATKRLQQIEYFKHRQDNAEERRKATAHAVALHRRWQQVKRPRPRRVLPRQVAPKAVAVEYARALKTLLRLAFEAYKPIIDALKARRTDANDDHWRVSGRTYVVKPLQSKEAKQLLDEAEKRLNDALSVSQVESLASKFAARTSTYQRVQMGRQVQAALGADPFVRDQRLAGAREDFIAQNVSLIKRIPKRLHEKIEGMVMNAVGKAELNVDLGKVMQAQFGVSERHAMFVARDQIAKYYGAVNRARQQDMGITRFIWRTVNDERVRDSHDALNGETFSWDDLPTNERGEEIYPGSDYQCRCTAEPVLDDLLNDVDEAEEAMEPDFSVEPMDDEDEEA